MRLIPVLALLSIVVMPVHAQTSASPQERAAAMAETQARIRGIEAALRNITAEQQAVYQQFEMVQEMRSSARQSTQGLADSYTAPSPPPNYEEIVREKQAREARLESYTLEMERLYARHRELEDRKQPLLQELGELATRAPR